MKSKIKKYKKITIMVLVILIICSMWVISASATGDVAGAIENTWIAAKVQIKSVVNNVVFPIIDLILAILFFTKISLAYMDYRKHGQFEFTAPAILFACLVFTLTAPLYVWGIIGM